jgi:hypothetical protein
MVGHFWNVPPLLWATSDGADAEKQPDHRRHDVVQEHEAKGAVLGEPVAELGHVSEELHEVEAGEDPQSRPGPALAAPVGTRVTARASSANASVDMAASRPIAASAVSKSRGTVAPSG